ncbi:MAG: undecaprenyl-diphosphate phosphatase [Chloroflexi bacterium]|nr:undecaprenyl-diphosphate phosphatase [Chloroflexota bacterium]
MIEWLKVVILGIVQGITEYLPISSTGHLIVAAALLDFGQRMQGTFEIFIQVGSVVAVLVFYRAELLQQIRSIPHDAGIRRFWLGIVVAVIPAAALGFLLKDWIKEVLYAPAVVAVSLIVGGIIFLIVERRPIPIQTTDVTAVSLRQALTVGVAQMVALIPGVSRSGASIIGGRLAGLDRRTATQFSFYLAIPILGAATIFDLLTSLDTLSPDDVGYLLVGAAVSAVVSWAAMGWLLRYVSRNNFNLFGVYRIVAGIIILALIAAGMPLN